MYGIQHLADLDAMLSRAFHGFPQLLKAKCVMVPLNGPKSKLSNPYLVMS
jgi:hypothetical protein